MSQKVGLTVKKPENRGKDTVSKKPKADISRPGPMASPVEQILHLQRTIGNRAVTRLIQSGALQAKLKIGKPNDIYEKEADHMADRLMRMSEGELAPAPASSPSPKRQEKIRINSLIQRQPDEEEEAQAKLQVQRQKEEEEEPVQARLIQKQPEEEPIQSKFIPKKENNETATSTLDSGFESRLNSTKGSGNPLPDNTRNFMENRFGADFSSVKIHTDSNAVQMNKALNAQAFTCGNDIYFNSGKYNPNTSSGKHLLAHELTHTVQQCSQQKSFGQKISLQSSSGYHLTGPTDYLVEQYDPLKSIGPVDLDTGNCTLGAKLINLKLVGILDTKVTLDQVLKAFYTKKTETKISPLSQPIKFVYGLLKYRKRNNYATTKSQVLKAKLLSFGTAYWGFGKKVSSGSVISRPVYYLYRSSKQIKKHGYMVMTASYGEEYTYFFYPKTKPISGFKNSYKKNYKFIRNACNQYYLRLFVEYLKKNLPGSILISSKNAGRIKVKEKTTTRALVRGKSYVVADPDHFYVIKVTDINNTNITYNRYDPRLGYARAITSNLKNLKKIESFYEYIK